ncbi:MAG: NPXTG-anchored protein, partial [Oscillospiraceae bacterium]|nr:NPXTG-anchored protein [Oscillospiraceae bacterium]
KSIFAKVAAVACSVATLGALGIAASAQKNTEVADRKDLVDGKTNIIAGIVQAEAGETVQFPVYIANNTKDGFAATGLRLFYDEKLTPVLKENGKPKTTTGVACNAVVSKFSHNADKHIIGLGTMGDDPETDNGLMYTVEITVPSDAKPGDKFPMTLEVDKWLDAKTNAIEYATVNGYIFIDISTPETTTVSSDTTTTTTTTTSSSATTTSTTSSSATTTTTTVSTSSGSTTTTTGTTKGANVVQTTTAKSGNSGTTTATKTGDAGVGVAVAGLLLAAGTAVVAKKKKD